MPEINIFFGPLIFLSMFAETKTKNNMKTTTFTTGDLKQQCSTILLIHKIHPMSKLIVQVKKYIKANQISEISATKLSELSGLDIPTSLQILIYINKEIFKNKN